MQKEICSCGRRIQQPLTGRRRLKCEKCSPRQAPRARVVTLPIDNVSPGRIAHVVREALGAVNKLETPDGAVALHLAELLDQGGHTGPSAASLARELRAACTAALAGTGDGADLIDELRAKRDA